MLQLSLKGELIDVQAEIDKHTIPVIALMCASVTLMLVLVGFLVDRLDAKLFIPLAITARGLSALAFIWVPQSDDQKFLLMLMLGILIMASSAMIISVLNFFFGRIIGSSTQPLSNNADES